MLDLNLFLSIRRGKKHRFDGAISLPFHGMDSHNQHVVDHNAAMMTELIATVNEMVTENDEVENESEILMDFDVDVFRLHELGSVVSVVSVMMIVKSVVNEHGKVSEILMGIDIDVFRTHDLGNVSSVKKIVKSVEFGNE